MGVAAAPGDGSGTEHWVFLGRGGGGVGEERGGEEVV